MAYYSTLEAAEALGRAPETKLVGDRYGLVTEILGRELGLPS